MRKKSKAFDLLAYRIPDFADSAGISRSYAYQMIKEGRLRKTKVGRVSLILREDAEDFLRRQRDGEEVSPCRD